MTKIIIHFKNGKTKKVKLGNSSEVQEIATIISDADDDLTAYSNNQSAVWTSKENINYIEIKK